MPVTSSPHRGRNLPQMAETAEASRLQHDLCSIETCFSTSARWCRSSMMAVHQLEGRMVVALVHFRTRATRDRRVATRLFPSSTQHTACKTPISLRASNRSPSCAASSPCQRPPHDGVGVTGATASGYASIHQQLPIERRAIHVLRPSPFEVKVLAGMSIATQASLLVAFLCP